MNKSIENRRNNYPGGKKYLKDLNEAYDDLLLKQSLNFEEYLKEIYETLNSFLNTGPLSKCKTSTTMSSMYYGMTKINPWANSKSLKNKKNSAKIGSGCVNIVFYNKVKGVVQHKRKVSLFNPGLASKSGYVYELLTNQNVVGVEKELRDKIIAIKTYENYLEFFVEGDENSPNYQDIEKLKKVLVLPTGINYDSKFDNNLKTLKTEYELFKTPFKPQYTVSSFNNYNPKITRLINILGSINDYKNFLELKDVTVVIEEESDDENGNGTTNPIRRGNNRNVNRRTSTKPSSNDNLSNDEIRNIAKLLEQVLTYNKSAETQQTVSVIKKELREEELNFDDLIELAEKLGTDGTKLVEMLKKKKAEVEKAKGVTITAETDPKVNELKSQLVIQQAMLAAIQKQLADLISKTSASGSSTPTSSTFDNSDTAKWYNYQLETLNYINSLPEFTDSELKAYFNDTNTDTSFILLLEKVIKGKNAKTKVATEYVNLKDILNDKKKIGDKIAELQGAASAAPASAPAAAPASPLAPASGATVAPSASPTAASAGTAPPAAPPAPPAAGTENQSKIELLQSIVDGYVALEKYEVLIDTFNRKIINKIRTTPDNDTLILIKQLMIHINSINELHKVTYGGYKVKSKKIKKSKKTKKNRSKGRSKLSRRRR